VPLLLLLLLVVVVLLLLMQTGVSASAAPQLGAASLTGRSQKVWDCCGSCCCGSCCCGRRHLVLMLLLLVRVLLL
jgi:hypothetical protein